MVMALQSQTGFDAFISFKSIQSHQARAIQRFIEAATPHGSPPMKVFLDATDIRGGDLNDELGAALDASRYLILCCSPEAADSRWVQKEVARFLVGHGSHDVIPAWLSGPLELAVPDELDRDTLRIHDLRAFWFGRWPGPRARDELARIYARLADADLRSVIDWERRRRTRIFAGLTLAGAVMIGAVGAGIESQKRTEAAQVNLDLLASEATGDEALREIARSSIVIRRRAASLVAHQPARAAVAVRTGWPVALMGLDHDLARELLDILRAALVATSDQQIDPPRLANYRYALGLLQDSRDIQNEMVAILRDVRSTKEGANSPDSIYQFRARHKALMTGYVDLLSRVENPVDQVPVLRSLFVEMELQGTDGIEDAMVAIGKLLCRRGVAFDPIEGLTLADNATCKPQLKASIVESPDHSGVVVQSRERLQAGSTPQKAAQEYAAAISTVTDARVLASERLAIERLLKTIQGHTQWAEVLKAAAALAVKVDDAAFTTYVAALLTQHLAPPRAGGGLLPRFYGPISIPAGLGGLPQNELNGGHPRSLVFLVAEYGSLGLVGLTWEDLTKRAKPWTRAVAAAIEPVRLHNLLMQERKFLDQELLRKLWGELVNNCIEYIAYVRDANFLTAEMVALAQQLNGESDGQRARLLLKLYEAAGQRLWRDLDQIPDRAAVAQLLALVTHPLWAERFEFLDSIAPPWPAEVAHGIVPFAAWAKSAHGVLPTVVTIGSAPATPDSAAR